MSVTSEKNAVKAAMLTVLQSVVPAATSANVSMYVIPDPCNDWPQIVLSRIHYEATELYAGGQKGNDDNNPNLYVWEYFDQLASQTGATVEATMDTHDAFLEALITYFQGTTGHYLADGGGVRQVNAAGERVSNDANKQGPYDLIGGISTILSTGQITVKQLDRPVLP